jgi:tetratricopeptide (TPR) repeat protein
MDEEGWMRFWRSGLVAFGLVIGMAAAAPGQVVNAQGQAPFFGGGAGGDKPSPQTAARKKKVDQLEAQYKKKPTASLKNQLAQAYYDYGHAQMTDSALSPKVKYRGALKSYRQALKLNPNHKQAKADKDMIESIYRQMGRPIPQ